MPDQSQQVEGNETALFEVKSIEPYMFIKDKPPECLLTVLFPSYG